MTTTTIRKKVHQYVDDIDGDLLEAVYNILNHYCPTVTKTNSIG